MKTKQTIIAISALIIFGLSSCGTGSKNIDTMQEVDNCLAKAASAKKQTFAAASLQCETLNWSETLFEKERVWMVIYQIEDKNQSTFILNAKDAKEQEVASFRFHIDDYKLEPGTYSFDNETYNRVEWDVHGDDLAKVKYSGKEIKDGKLIITAREENMMKGRITCTIPDLSLQGAQEATHKNIKCDISFYYKKPFKFKH